MEIYITCEPNYINTYWCRLYKNGIETEAKRKNMGVTMVTSENMAVVAAGADKKTKPVVIVLGTSLRWISDTVSSMRQLGIKPLAMSCGMDGTSRITPDYKGAIYCLLDYMSANGRNKTALFAVNTDSAADLIKKDAFLSYKSESHGRFSESDVFSFNGVTADTCEKFSEVASHYDSVISTNDVSAVILTQFLTARGVRIPDDLFLAAFGNMLLSRSRAYGMTMALLNCAEVGRQAVTAALLLDADPKMSEITITTACEIIIGKTTANIPVSSEDRAASFVGNTTATDFYTDPEVGEIFSIEKILNVCDELDINILRCIIQNMKYIDISEMLHISENTVKYRLKKIIKNADLNSREDILQSVRMII